jgi:predicted phage terminase large subunit-like protein
VNIKNQRPTKVVIDDAEDDDMVRSTERRLKFHSWLTNVVIPSIDRERGFIKMIGTVLNDDCELLRFYKMNGGIFRKAIEEGQPIWWPLEKLEQLKNKIGSIAFAQEYLNEPTNDETAMVKFGWLKFYDRGSEPKNLTKYAFADLAISSSSAADYFVIVVVGVDEQGGVWVIDLFRQKGLTFASQVEAVIHTHIKHQTTRFGIESVAYQRALEQEVKRQGNAMKPPVYVPAVPVTPDTDKARRLLRHSAQIENGTVHFLREHTDLIEELTRFPNAGHDDCVDAFSGVMELIVTKKRAQIFVLDDGDDMF